MANYARPESPEPLPQDDPDDDEGPPLWGPNGPEVGQVITIAGTGMQTRWTGTHWELVK